MYFEEAFRVWSLKKLDLSLSNFIFLIILYSLSLLKAKPCKINGLLNDTQTNIDTLDTLSGLQRHFLRSLEGCPRYFTIVSFGLKKLQKVNFYKSSILFTFVAKDFSRGCKP